MVGGGAHAGHPGAGRRRCAQRSTDRNLPQTAGIIDRPAILWPIERDNGGDEDGQTSRV